MVDVTYVGKADYLRVASGRLLPAGVRTEVTNADAEPLQGRADVDIHEPDED